MAHQHQRYKVVERIAAGGMAEVYRAESAGLEGFKKTVAIKRVLPHLSEKKQFIGMFLDEARLSAHLNHSNCVQVFDIGVGDNTYFIVMEYVDGSDLKAALEYLSMRNQRMPLACALYICCRICEGLSYAHEARDNRGRLLGIVHRDISPPNVLITRYGEVKVVDFGLAKANSQLEHSEPGIIKGKFSYLSPEAALGESVDLRTDIFAVGIILWEMLAGRRLFMGETDLQTVRQVQAAKIPDIRNFNPEVNDQVVAILQRALARDPRERYQTARDLGQDLNHALFQTGQVVSAYDVAALVSEVVAERDRKKSREKQSIIGTLIEDAMMEFTSLDSGNSLSNANFRSLHSTTSSLASQPLDSFEDVQDWASDLGLERPSTGDATSRYSVGNLAALEEEGHRAIRPAVPPVTPAELLRSSQQLAPVAPPPAAPVGNVGAGYAPASSSMPPRASGPPPALLRASQPAPSMRQKASRSMVAAVVALALAAGAAGAYLSGLL